jgi:hypothetical protein
MKKISVSIVSTLALFFSTLLFPAFVLASSSISLTSFPPTSCQLSTTQITVSGTAIADAPPGQLQQYAVDINWGDGSSNTVTAAGVFGSGGGTSPSVPFTGSHTYSAPGTYSIVATIYHQNINGQDNVSTGAGAFVVCIVSPLTISKTASTTLDRSYAWTLDKTVSSPTLTLADGELFVENYGVTVGATPTDSNWGVYGNISVTNPVGNPTITVNVTDNMATDGSATVVCPQTSIDPGATLVCTYSKSLPAANNQVNTATITASESVLNGTANANVDFSTAVISKIDECIAVTDTNPLGPQGAVVCAGVDTLPKTFNYSVNFGKNQSADVVLVCGANSYSNTASFETVDDANDTAQSGSDSVTVDATVNCPILSNGCTLTQGYWKTHNDSFKGGAPTDDNWEHLTSEEQTSFAYLLGSDSWFNILWSAPKGGNVWYQLAHQWMAAQLNVWNGASASAITPALANAEAWLHLHSPLQKLKAKDATDAAAWASLLGSYNEGLIGPGHCSEQTPPQSQTLTFTATNSNYYNGPTSSDPLYAAGPISFTWNTTTGVVTGGNYDEVYPANIGTTYYNVVTSGTVSGSTVNLTFLRTNPNNYGPFTFTGTLVGNTLTGTLDGPYYFTATGTVAP